MADPVMVAIAVAVATKTAEGISDAGRAALGRLVALVTRKLRADPATRDDLPAAQAQPDDDALIQRLAGALRRAADRDEAFGADLAHLWTVVGEDRTSGVVNQVSGTVSGTVVQAGEVHGGITFGAR